MATAPQKISARTAGTAPYDGTEQLAGYKGANDRRYSIAEIRRLPASTVALLPSAATEGAGALRYVSDGAAGKLVVSNGATWEYSDGSAV